MNWLPFDTWIVLTAAASGVACAVPGSFLLLRRMSMMGDAISHAVLPGLAIAFLVTGDRTSLAMFIGAALVGLLTALFTQWVHRFGQIEEGASMGVVFTSFFAVGLILMVQAADEVDLDADCVLYGAVEYVPLEVAYEVPATSFGVTSLEEGSWKRLLFSHYTGEPMLELPRATLVLFGVCLFNVLLVLIFFKELKITSFDPALATTLGFSANLIHYGHMMVVAITTVAAFEAVGSIIVIAMLIVPPATAYLMTHRLSVMLWLSALLAIMAAFLGHLGALVVPGWFGFEDTSTSGMMAVVSGLLFGLVALSAQVRKRWQQSKRNGAET